MPLVIEGVLTTENVDGSLHFAPMGPVVNEDFTQWKIKPFQTSSTFQNLKHRPRGVFHVVDDCFLLAAAATGTKLEVAAHFESKYGWILDDNCHWYALNFDKFDLSGPRAAACGKVVEKGVTRPFWGWNRAKHAVLEAAILATRKHMLPREQIELEWNWLVTRVEKTGGKQEHLAMQLLARDMNLPYQVPNSF